MNGNRFELDFENEISQFIESKEIMVSYNSDFVYDGISNHFPFYGSKINWIDTRSYVFEHDPNCETQILSFQRFFYSAIKSNNLSGEVLYVGDSATNFLVKGSLFSMKKVLIYLLPIPQHHYFVSNDFSWCINFTMEGGMGFGFSNGAT